MDIIFLLSSSSNMQGLSWIIVTYGGGLCNREKPQTVYSVKRMYVQGASAPRTYIISPNRLFGAFLQLKT